MGRPWVRQSEADAVASAVSRFGAEVKPRLQGPGEPEDQLRAPTEALVRSIAEVLGVDAVMHGEVRLADLRARPDYQVDVAGAPVGFIEIKRPGKSADPNTFRGRDAAQWKKLSLLPNILYTDGSEWALWRSGERSGSIVRLKGSIRHAGPRLAPRDDKFLGVLREFLLWEPQPPRDIDQLVRALANLCKFLRTEVVAALELEARGHRTSLYRLLAEEWRNLLFPDEPDGEFADQYAQTVTFALLLAQVQGIELEGQDLSVIAKKLRKKHLLLGRALAVLTDDVLGDLGTSLNTMIRVIGAVNLDELVDRREEAYLWLYEKFLAAYDPTLRQQTGSYYTPNEVVAYLTRAADELLRSRLGIRLGFAAPQVVTIDPAMGTGTFLVHILERAADAVAADEAEGTVGPRLREIAKDQLIGFEKQIGPYAVAELRLFEALQRRESDAPAQGLRLYIADTLESPWIPQTPYSVTSIEIARSRELANKVKLHERVLVAIGNPPHDKAPKGAGKWVETGEGGPTEKAPLDAFRLPGNGRYEYVLANMHVHFWRWATWKVFDYHQDAPSGIVALISPSAYLTSRGFAGMRTYLRQTADEGWIIDLSPEGHQPDPATRIFPEVQQPLCIGIFLRRGPPQPHTPAMIHYIALSGRQREKFDRLGELRFDGPGWATCPTGWQAPFMPELDRAWTDSPALEDLFPWSSRGVTPGRTWVYAPDKETLTLRWRQFITATTDQRRHLLREAPPDRELDSVVGPLPGITPHTHTLAEETADAPLEPVQIGHRAFDRKWVIPDNRLMVRPRPDLWRVRGPKQIYMTQSVHPLTCGPALTFTACVPDMHHYNGRSGRAIPLYRDAKATAPNLAPKLLSYLAQRIDMRLEPEDILAYIAAVAAHPAYTERFLKQLRVPGVRVPLSDDRTLWAQAIRLGRRVLWLHTYGERCIDRAADQPEGPPRLPQERRYDMVEVPDTEEGMPAAIAYDPTTQTLHVGAGRIWQVPPEVWAYEISGWRVVKRWFDYRKRNPRGRRSSELDDIVRQRWTSIYTTELLNLLQVLNFLVDLQPEQAALLDRICAGPQIIAAELQTAAVIPPPPGARRPLIVEGATLLDQHA